MTSFYNEKEQLYLEREALGVGLGASLLLVMNGMWFPRNDATNNASLWPIAFASTSLSSAETWYSNIETKA